MSDKPISAIVYAPVVSTDITSPEAILATNTKKIQAQAATDGHFDTVLERFRGSQTNVLLGLTIAFSLLLVSVLTKRRK
jgi:hypothetical protein